MGGLIFARQERLVDTGSALSKVESTRPSEIVRNSYVTAPKL